MGNINLLDKHIAELIAAGEVVERPSSVVKELVENSIDAGATCVTVDIKDGGTTYIRVTDNGLGILKDDIKKAFLKSATSKIKNAEDLEKISTLGFRGEALSSICAVAKVEVITKTKEDFNGTHYEINGGEEVLLEDFGCPDGTTVIVKDLFYNVPARMKFLKKDTSEANAIAKLIDKMALSNPGISFKFIRNGKDELTTPGNQDISSTIYSVYGKEFIDSLLPVEYSLAGLSVNGYISKPYKSRPNRNMQHFFINGRYVKTRTAMAALEEAFKGSIMVQKFPSCVLYIHVPFETVDVNVHPSKVEVRFIDEKPIFELIYHGVKTALLKNDKPINLQFSNLNICPIAVSKSENVSFTNPELTIKEEPEIFVPKKVPATNRGRDVFQIFTDQDPFSNLKPGESLRATLDNTSGFVEGEPKQQQDEIVEPVSFVESSEYYSDFSKREPTRVTNDEKKTENFSLIGEIFDTYFIAQKNRDEIVFIDKHAAHERLIYEKLKSQKTSEHEQILLEPVTVTLSKDEYDAVLSNVSLFKNSGFDIENFGIGSVIVRSTPMSFEVNDIKNIIIEMAGNILKNKKEIDSSYAEWLYQNIACRAAIKAGTACSKEEIISLINNLKDEDLRYCPHGRPILVAMKKKEIEKQFGRM